MIDTENLQNALLALKTSTPQMAAQLAKLFISCNFKKGTILNTPDHSFPIIYFIEVGLARGYFFYHQEEYTSWVLESGFLLPSAAFFSKELSIEFVQFLNDSSCWSLNLNLLDDIAQKQPLIYRMLLEIYEKSMHNCKHTELMLRLKHAEDRYLYKKKRNENGLGSLTNRIAASFLNIDPKYFSKIKNKYKKG